MAGPKIKTFKSVDMMEVLNELQDIECAALDLKNPGGGVRWTLPDGRDPIYRRLWDEIRKDQHGNQQFGNDMMYMVTFEGRPDLNYYKDREEYYSEDSVILYDYCKDALNDIGSGIDMILFEVCW